MKCYSLFAVLPALSLASSVSTSSSSHRRLDDAPLTDLGDICSLLLSATLGAALPQIVGAEDSPITCGCNPTLFPDLSISFECESNDPVCIPGIICGTPSIEAGLDITALLGGESPISFEACYTGAVIAGAIGVPDQILCFSFLQTLLGAIGIGPLGDANATVAAENAKTERTCEATMDGQQCSSCSFCNGGKGLDFDCTNIELGIKSSTCVAMNLPNDMEAVSHPDKMIAA